MAKYGYPEVYGETEDGYCGHCGGHPRDALRGSWGAFCGACFRWRTYSGPKQWWGDGMRVTQHRVNVYPNQSRVHRM